MVSSTQLPLESSTLLIQAPCPREDPAVCPTRIPRSTLRRTTVPLTSNTPCLLVSSLTLRISPAYRILRRCIPTRHRLHTSPRQPIDPLCSSSLVTSTGYVTLFLVDSSIDLVVVTNRHLLLLDLLRPLDLHDPGNTAYSLQRSTLRYIRPLHYQTECLLLGIMLAHHACTW